MLLVNAKSVSDYFKENMQVIVMMKQKVSEDDALKFRDKLENEDFIKNIDFISKDINEDEQIKIDNSIFTIQGMVWDTSGGLLEWAIRNGFIEQTFRKNCIMVWNVG